MFIDDLRKAIRENQPIAPLLDGCIRPPKQTSNPLINMAKAWFGEERLKALILDAIKDNLFSSIRENQEALRLLNTDEGRKYLHKNLDSLLDYLTSAKFSQTVYKCPACRGVIIGKVASCTHCKIALKWKS